LRNRWGDGGLKAPPGSGGKTINRLWKKEVYYLGDYGVLRVRSKEQDGGIA